jgi:hypothetical protein
MERKLIVSVVIFWLAKTFMLRLMDTGDAPHVTAFLGGTLRVLRDVG